MNPITIASLQLLGQSIVLSLCFSSLLPSSYPSHILDQPKYHVLDNSNHVLQLLYTSKKHLSHRVILAFWKSRFSSCRAQAVSALSYVDGFLVGVLADICDGEGVASGMATPRRSTRAASRGVTTSDSLPAIQVKQSYAYGSPGTPTLPRKLVKQDGSKTAAELLAAGVAEAKLRRKGMLIPEPLLPVPPSPLEGRRRKPPLRLTPIREPFGHGVGDGSGWIEPGGHFDHHEGSSTSLWLSRTFFPERGLFRSIFDWTITISRFLFKWTKRLLKYLFLLGLLLAPLWAAWFWGPSLGRKLHLPALSERFTSPFTRPYEYVRPGNNQEFGPDVSAIVNRMSALERSFKDIRIGAAVAGPPSAVPARQVNFFSTGLGAVVDPYLSSPTKKREITFLQRGVVSFLGLDLRKPLPPVAALEPWDDIGDCWCAPPGRGKAQLAVLLPRLIYPTAITVEHISPGASLDIAAAPKDMELWVQIHDEETREAVANAAFPLLGDVIDSSNNLGPTYVRIGTWQYSIHKPNNVQTFNMAVDLEHFNAKVEKVVVRATTNWGGQDYTCFYRLRLFGKLADGVQNTLENFPLE